MGVACILDDWSAGVNDLFCGCLHGHQTKALSQFSLAMVRAGHCHSGRLAACATAPRGTARAAPAAPASQQRRWERLVANQRLDGAVALRQMGSTLVHDWGGRKLLLVLDETPNGAGLRSLRVGVAYRKRLVPLVAECHPTDRPSRPLPQLVCQLLREAADLLPEDTQATLLCDRGLAWPQVMDCVRDLGWGHVMRLQHSTRVRFRVRVRDSKDSTSVKSGGQSGRWRERSVGELAPRPGCRWQGEAEIFKKAGWRKAKLTVLWDERAKEPWALAARADAVGHPGARAAGTAMALAYAKRNWCEQSFRDEKSSGFCWQQSRVRQPQRVMRVLLVIALATLLALSLGSWLIKSGQRHLLDPHGRKRLSLFQLGRRWLLHLIGSDGAGPPARALPPAWPYLRPP